MNPRCNTRACGREIGPPEKKNYAIITHVFKKDGRYSQHKNIICLKCARARIKELKQMGKRQGDLAFVEIATPLKVGGYFSHAHVFEEAEQVSG